MNTKIPPPPIETANNDPRLMEHKTYRNAISEPAPPLDPLVDYEIERHFLYVNSAMRDRSQYPNPASFKLNLLEPFRDVISIELFSGVLPNQGNIYGDQYVLLDIPEFNHIKGADGSRYFGVLSIQRHTSNVYLNLDKSNTIGMPATFKPPKSRLDSFTVILRHPDGSTVTFGTESPDTPADLTIQCQFTFEIRTKVRRRMCLDRDTRVLPENMMFHRRGRERSEREFC
jgi:hypothetical protein